MRHSNHFYSAAVSAAATRLGERIRRARKAQGLTLGDLERLCRIHRTTIGRLERGDAGTSVGALLTVLEALNELADAELIVSRPETPKHQRAVPAPVLERDF